MGNNASRTLLDESSPSQTPAGESRPSGLSPRRSSIASAHYSQDPEFLVNKVNRTSVNRQRAKKVDKTVYVVFACIISALVVTLMVPARFQWWMVGVEALLALFFYNRTNRVDELRAKTHGTKHG